MTARELHDRLAAGGATFLGEVVVVAREKAKEVSKGGIVFVDPQRQQYAAVIGFGDDSRFAPGGAKDGKVLVGDSLYLSAYGGVVIKQKIGDEVYELEALHDKDILLAYRAKEDPELEEGVAKS